MTDEYAAALTAAFVKLAFKHQDWLRRHEVTPTLRESRLANAAAALAAETLGVRAPRVRFFRAKHFGEYDTINKCLWIRAGQTSFEMANTARHELAHHAQRKAGAAIGHGRKYSPAAFAAGDPRVTERLRRAVARRKHRKADTA